MVSPWPDFNDDDIVAPIYHEALDDKYVSAEDALKLYKAFDELACQLKNETAEEYDYWDSVPEEKRLWLWTFTAIGSHKLMTNHWNRQQCNSVNEFVEEWD